MVERVITEKVGKVFSVNRSSQKGTPKKPVGYGYFKLGVGMAGDAHSNPDNPARQVSLLAIEDYSLYDKDTPVGTCCENITTEGIELSNLPIGTQLYIGKEVLLQIGQIGKECHTDHSAQEKKGECIIPTRGVFAYVRAEGEISVGDSIRIVKSE